MRVVLNLGDLSRLTCPHQGLWTRGSGAEPVLRVGKSAVALLRALTGGDILLCKASLVNQAPCRKWGKPKSGTQDVLRVAGDSCLVAPLNGDMVREPPMPWIFPSPPPTRVLRVGGRTSPIRDSASDEKPVPLEHMGFLPASNEVLATTTEAYELLKEEGAAVEKLLKELRRLSREKNASPQLADPRLRSRLEALREEIEDLYQGGLTEVVWFKGTRDGGRATLIPTCIVRGFLRNGRSVREHRRAAHWRRYTLRDRNMRKVENWASGFRLDDLKERVKRDVGVTWEESASLVDPVRGAYRSFKRQSEMSGVEYETSGNATLGRFAVDVEGTALWQPLARKMKLAAGLEADAAVLEGRVAISAMLPDARGWHAHGGKGERTFDLGHFRASATGGGSLYVGASLSVASELSYDQREFKGGFGLTAGGFAGGKVALELKIAGEWLPPGETSWTTLVSVTANPTVAGGLGTTGDLTIEYVRGKVYIRANVEVVVGIGGGLPVMMEIDVPDLLKLGRAVCKALRDADFGHLDWVSSRAFACLTAVQFALLAYDKIEPHLDAVIEWAESNVSALLGASMDLETERMAEKINEMPHALRSMTPEARAALLRRLCDSTALFHRQEDQETAVLNILESCETRREYECIVKRLPRDAIERRVERGEAMIRDFLDGEQRTAFERWREVRMKEWSRGA